MISSFTTGTVVLGVDGDMYILTAAPIGALMGSTGRSPGLESYVGEGFYHARRLGTQEESIIPEDYLELAPGLSSGPYHVAHDGVIRSYEVSGRDSVMLSDGTTVSDSGEYFFATLDAAVAMRKALSESLSKEDAVSAHRDWHRKFTASGDS
jgi:hypothetical protein